MSSLPPIISRSSAMQTSDNLLGHLQRTNARLAQAQEQLATGKAVNGPSDAAAKTPAILMLRQQLASAEREGRDLEHARTTLDRIDHTLGEANNLVNEAHNHALGEIGLGADAGTRQAAAEEVDATIRAMLDLANTSHQGIALFGGTKGGEAPPFESFLGGIRYNGNAEALQLDGHTLEDQNINGTGVEAFGDVTATVASPNSLQPLAVADTRIADVDGATQEGVNRGQVRVTVDGTTTSVDLTDADKLGDVVNRINSAIDSVDPGAGQLDLAGEGFELTANAGHAIAIEDDTNDTARTLGLRLDAAGGTDAGPSVHPRVTDGTRLADLGSSIDLASGMEITQGEQTKVADFSEAETVEDLKNIVADLNLGVRLEINGDGPGLNLVNEVSGVALSVGEAGGTTASDLGLRTLDSHTPLSAFRQGRGVEPVAGESDLAISL